MTKDAKKETIPLAVRDSLMERRTVWLHGNIDPDSIHEVMGRLVMLQSRSNDRIDLIIQSHGGKMNAAFALCDLMSTIMTAPVRGIALGECGSSATFIMLHCTERVAMPHARFLIHSGHWDVNVPIGADTTMVLRQLAQDIQHQERFILEVYTQRLTPLVWRSLQPSDAEKHQYVRKLMARGDQKFDTRLTAQEAVDIGLVTHISTEKLDIFPA